MKTKINIWFLRGAILFLLDTPKVSFEDCRNVQYEVVILKCILLTIRMCYFAKIYPKSGLYPKA